jgi:signal transduction histidine kinase
MKDDFISMASHELRAPIAAIRGYISLFLDDAFGKLDDKARQVMNTTMALSTHLSVLVDDLLEVSRLEQGRMKMDLELLSVEPLIAEIVDLLKNEAAKKNLAFEFRKPATELPRISADKSRLKQVLINLCSNAIKYTPSGSVTVTADLKEGDMVEVRVMDTGLGMSSEAREKLFQKFYRVRTNDTATIPGTGLGLWITKQIVELMRGKIFCDSIERVGTQMSVLFPAAARGAALVADTTVAKS